MPLNQNDGPVLHLINWGSFLKNDENINLYFSDDVIAGSGDIILSNGSDMRLIPINDSSQVTFSSKSGESDSSTDYGRKVTINPSTDLVPGTDYSLQIASGVIQDLVGNDYAGFDKTASIQGSNPTLSYNMYREGPLLWDGGSRFKIDDSIKLYFDEPIIAGSGKIIISNGSDSQTIDVNDISQVTFGNEWGDCGITINPTLDLIPNTNYSVEIANGVINDRAGNPYTGTGSNEENTIKFTAHNSNPLMIWSNPLDNSFFPFKNSFFKIDDDIILEFDEEVVPGNGNITISNGSDTRIVDIHDASQVSYADETHHVGKINLFDDLTPGTNYSIQITEGAILDKAGNPYIDIGVSAPINFTTISSNPKISWTSFSWSDPTSLREVYPFIVCDDETTTDSARFLPVEKYRIDNDLELTFDERVMAGHGEIVISNTDGSDVRNIAVDDTNQVTFDGFRTVIINPLTDLLPDTTYHIQMNSGVIVDSSGNPYDGVQDETTLDFVTGNLVDGIGFLSSNMIIM